MGQRVQAQVCRPVRQLLFYCVVVIALLSAASAGLMQVWGGDYWDWQITSVSAYLIVNAAMFAQRIAETQEET